MADKVWDSDVCHCAGDWWRAVCVCVCVCGGGGGGGGEGKIESLLYKCDRLHTKNPPPPFHKI